jgi:hypothetical protein
MKHVMLDLETMGTKPYSAIIGIGAAYFDPRGSSVLDSFHVTIDIALAQKRGFRLDAGAVAWWLAPAQRPAWDAYLSLAHFSPDDAMNGFGQWLDTVSADREDIAFWGNGAGFDCNLMHNAADLMGLGYTNKDGNPRDGLWPYSNDRCFRTMKNLTYNKNVPNEAGAYMADITAKSLCPPDVGIAHVAVDDAIHQAQWLQAICTTFDIIL